MLKLFSRLYGLYAMYATSALKTEKTETGNIASALLLRESTVYTAASVVLH